MKQTGKAIGEAMKEMGDLADKTKDALEKQKN